MSATETTTPAEVEVVRSFVNTIDHEDGTDELGTPAELRRWLVANGHVTGQVEATDTDLELARRLRSALRDELAAHHAGRVSQATLRAVDEACADLPLRVVSAPAGLAPLGTGVRAGLAAIAGAAATSRIKGSWSRLKICPADDCRWAFYDASRNRSRRWCSMEVCGNRSKVRAFRERH